MNSLKDISSWACLYLVGLLFFLLAGVFAVLQIVNPDTIKDTLKEQGTYSKVVPAVLETAGNENISSKAGQLPLKEDWVKQAAQNAFPPSELEQKTNMLIDGTFRWLEGDTETPQFTLDFTQNKQQLGDEVGRYVENRLQGLPRCTSLEQIPANFDAYSITCLPPGVNPSLIASDIATQIKTDQEFLQDPVITYDEASTEAKKDSGNDPFAQLESIRTAYQNREVLKWLLPILIIIFAAAGVYLAKDRATAVRRLYRSFLITALGLFVLYFVLKLGSGAVSDNVPGDSVSADLVVPIFEDIVVRIQNIYLIFALISLAIGIALIVASKRFAANLAPKK